MVNYIQCKHCHAEDSSCTYCNGSGYLEKKSFKHILNDIFSCLFPCLKENHSYKLVPTESNFYEDIFSMMNDIESTTLLDNNETINFDIQHEPNEVVYSDDSDSEDFDSDDSESIIKSNIDIKKSPNIRKIDIPDNFDSLKIITESTQEYINYSF